MNRTPADYGHIVLGEIDGREQRGAVERLIAEARGEKAAAPADDLGTATALLKLAELLNSDKAINARLADLKKATEAARAEQIAAAREKVAVEKLKADQAGEYAKHQQQMAQEREHHEGLLSAVGREAKTLKQAAANELKKAETDAAAVAQMKDKLARKLKLIEAA